MRKPTKNKRGRRGCGGGVEKYSRFLPPPLHSTGHDCEEKPETKPLQQEPSLKGGFAPHIWLCVEMWPSGGQTPLLMYEAAFLGDLG